MQDGLATLQHIGPEKAYFADWTAGGLPFANERTSRSSSRVGDLAEATVLGFMALLFLTLVC